MERHVYWSPWEGPGLEHLHIAATRDDVVADGVISAVAGGVPFHAHYLVRADAGWRARSLTVEVSGARGRPLQLFTDGSGTWSDGGGNTLPDLDGCIDVDISATPFTNSMPIRRLDLRAGESAGVTVVHVKLPQLEVRRARQRYTCREPLGAQGGLFTYESLFGGFEADLAVDPDGLVLDYPGTFRRLSEARASA